MTNSIFALIALFFAGKSLSLFGAIGVLAALNQRHLTGVGQAVQSGLFENNILLMAQHMMQAAITGKAPAPMPDRISAWM